MSNANTQPIAPVSMIVPVNENIVTKPASGAMVMSGGKLFCWASAWIELSGNNTGD